MVKWNRVCRSKCKGGLGVKDLAKQNISLLCKWGWKLENHKGLWQKIVRKRYLRNKIVTSVGNRTSDSPCWKALLSVEETYLAGRQVVLDRGYCQVLVRSLAELHCFVLSFSFAL
jgi:hypothetical protein